MDGSSSGWRGETHNRGRAYADRRVPGAERRVEPAAVRNVLRGRERREERTRYASRMGLHNMHRSLAHRVSRKPKATMECSPTPFGLALRSQ